MSTFRKVFVFFVFISAFSSYSFLYGQDSTGSVTGRVVDERGGVLQGAQVSVQPGGSTGKTNNQGEFTIRGLAPGNYSVSVAFVGFSSLTKDVAVASNQPTSVDLTLQVASKSEQIVVTAERVHGEAEAINREKSAENILQVLPAEVITSLPNANIADALGRLPSVTLERDEGEGKYVQIRGTEPRYSNVTIDGVNVPSPESGVRQIKLDTIPSDLVESVEISKTLTANQDGDAIGGSVNLRTKTAGETPTLSLFGLGGYTPIIGGRGVDQFGGTIGQRFGRDKRWGVLFGGAYDWNGRGIDDVEPAPTTVQCDPGNCNSTTVSSNAPYYGTYNTEDLREYRYYRTRYGFAGSADYKFSNNSSVYMHALYSHFDNFGDRWVYTPTINSFTTSPLQGGTDGNMSSNSQIRRPVDVVGSMVVGGRHDFRSASIVWEVSASRSSEEDLGYSSALFAPTDPASPLNNVQFGVDRSDPYRPKILPQNGMNIYDPTQYLFQNIDNNRSYSPQLNLQAAASYSQNYTVGGHFGTFEFGGKFRNAHKFDENRDNYYNVADGVSLPMSNYLGSFSNSNYYDKSYTLGPLVDYTKVTNFFNSNPGDFTFDSNTTHQQNDPNNFDLIERISAGYLMNAINFGKFRLYTGLRVEGTTEDVVGNTVVVDANNNYVSTNPLRKNGDYINVLGSAELKYAITTDSAIRVAFGQGIARPNFGDLAPYLNYNGANMRVDVGNPNLKATTANNYDLLYEHYLNPLGAIQVGFFYKDIGSPIYFIQTPVTSGEFAGYTQTQPINGTSASLYGFEASFEQRLAYLPGPLAGLGISANYSYTTSTANGVPGRSDHPALQRQAPHTWNISPTYDRGRVSFRLGLSYNAANIFAYNYQDGAPLGKTGPNGDNYLYAHLQADAQISLHLAKGFSTYVYGLNMNNEVFGFYNGSTQWPVQREYYQPTIAAGVRWSPTPEK